VSSDLVKHAWGRIHWVTDVKRDALENVVKSAQAVGFLRDVPDLGRLIAAP
jgi:NitT/TauT family transport system substrate-binding protein